MSGADKGNKVKDGKNGLQSVSLHEALQRVLR